MRNETGVKDLPLIVASYRNEGMPLDLSQANVSDYSFLNKRPYALHVLQAHYDARKELAPAIMVPMRDLKTLPQNVHFDAEGQMELGKLFARGYLDLTNPEKPKAERPRPK